MCGIFGMASTAPMRDWQKRQDVLHSLFYLSGLRGLDGSGLLFVPHSYNTFSDLLVHKAAIAPSYMCEDSTLFNNNEKFKYIVGHTRALTKGRAIYSHTHPFTVDNITLVHNGTLSNAFALNNKHYDVDSYALTVYMAKNGYKKALSDAEGPVAVVWHDIKTKRLYLYHDLARPLAYAKIKDDDTIFFASELSMLDFVIKRAGMVAEKLEEVPVDTVFSFDEKCTKLIKEAEIAKKAPAYIPFTPHGGNIGMTNRHRMLNNVAIQVFKTSLKPVKSRDQQKWLTGHGMAVGQAVNFAPIKLLLNDTLSKHGVLVGNVATKTKSSNGATIYVKAIFVGYAIEDLNKFRYMLQGVINRVVDSDDQHISGYIGTLVLKNPIPIIYDTSLNDFRPIQAESNVIPLQDVDQLASQTDESTVKHLDAPTIPGPSNTIISAQVFTELVKKGCSRCGQPILLKEADVTDWDGNKPVCIACYTYGV